MCALQLYPLCNSDDLHLHSCAYEQKANGPACMHSGHGGWVWLQWPTKIPFVMVPLDSKHAEAIFAKFDRFVALTTCSGA